MPRWPHDPSSLIPQRAPAVRRHTLPPVIAVAIIVPTLLACGSQEQAPPVEAEVRPSTRAASASSGATTGSISTTPTDRNPGNRLQQEPATDSAATRRPAPATAAPTPTERPVPHATYTPEPIVAEPDPMDQILKLLDPAEDEDNVLLANNVSTAAFRRVLDSGAAQITDMVLEEYPEPFKSYNQDGRLERTY